MSAMQKKKGEKTTILITRHPVTALNQRNMVQGARSNASLGKEGKKQAEKLKKELLKYEIDVILSSPMRRCLEGIAPYAKASKVPIVRVADFKERDYGAFDGKTAASYNEWKKEHKIRDNFDFAPPGGESFRAVKKRVQHSLRKAVKKYKGKRILIMGHKATDVALLLSIFNQKEETHYDKYLLSNASLTIVEISKGVPRLKLLNYTNHLLLK